MIDGFDAALAAVESELATLAAAHAGQGTVADALAWALAGGGKRLRPLLCLAAREAVDPDAAHTPAAVRAALALELIHTYSLVHDDLPCMDDDDLRRGRATTHREYGSAAAVLAGFALIPLAARLLDDSARELGLDPGARRAAVRELCRGAGAAGMVGGQMLDLQAEGRALDIASLRQVHAMKTGALFAAALRIGAILGRADTARVDALGRYGECLGMAFQIRDDVLDESAGPAQLGKTPGKDRDAGKSTFVVLLGAGDAHRAAVAEVDTALAALVAAGVESAPLQRLARFAVDRDR